MPGGDAVVVTRESDPRKKGTWRQRTKTLRRQTLLFMQRYLAFEVPVPATEEDEAAAEPAVDEVRATPRRPVVAETAAPRPAAAKPVRRVVRAKADGIPSFAAGECIGDAYDVLEAVNSGALRSTYRAHHRQWDIDLIVQVPGQKLAAAPGMLREWVASVERWAGLGVHPHIASCYSLQWIDDIPVSIIEYVGRDSLRTAMAADRSHDLQAALTVAIEVCQGLEHAHQRGVIHGSLAPDGILLTAQGVAKVSGFDMAVPAGKPAELVSLTLASVAPAPAPGTPGATLLRPAACAPEYIAPERWGEGYAAQPAADVFGLGACLYELFFGRPPYASTAGAPVILPDGERLTSGEAPPPDLVALLRRCVEWMPFRRPGSIETVRYELSAVHDALFGAAGAQAASPAQQAADWNTKAVSFYLMGKEADAEAAWASALAADPTCLEVWFNHDVAAWRRASLSDENVLEDLGAVAAPEPERWKRSHLLGLVHWERGDVEAALAAFEQAHRERPELTDVKDGLDRLRAAAGRAPAHPAVVGEHRQYVTAVALNINARTAVSASYDGTAALWDIATANPLRVLEGHSAPVSSVFLNAAGSLVLTGSDDGTLRLWDAASGVCRRIFDTHAGRIASACLSPDGRWFLWSGIHSSERVEQMTLQLWDTTSGRHVRTFEGLSSSVKSLCFSADGFFAVTGGDDHAVRLWELETGACLQVFTGHTHYVSAVCISPDNRLIVSGSWDRSVRFWDVESGKELRRCDGHSALVTAVAVSADAGWAFSGSWDATARLWDVTNGRCVRTFRGHTGLVTGVALSADARFGLSGSWDGTLRLWETAADRREAAQLRVPASSNAG